MKQIGRYEIQLTKRESDRVERYAAAAGIDSVEAMRTLYRSLANLAVAWERKHPRPPIRPEQYLEAWAIACPDMPWPYGDPAERNWLKR